MSGTDFSHAQRSVRLPLRYALTSVCLAALSACTVGPDYHKTAIKTTNAWHQSVTPQNSHPVTASADPQWWKEFNDPTLTALEQEVASANLDLQVASLRLQQSEAERKIASAAQMPHLGANASYARERASSNGILGLLGKMEQSTPGDIASGAQGFGPAALPGSVGNPSFNLPQYGMNASWEVDLWGHVRRQVEAATAALHASEDMRRDVIVSLMAETAQNYIDLRGVQAQMAILDHNINIARNSVKLTNMRFAQGAATRLDVADSTGQLRGFEARRAPLERLQVHLLNALSFLVAREPGTLNERLGKAGPIPPVPANLPVGLPSQLAERRPDIRMAEERLHVATASVGVAVADFFPRITLSGSLDIQALQFSGLGSWASRQYGFGPTATFPIFEGGRLLGQYRLRKAQQREAAIMLHRTVLKAWEEVDNAMADLATAQSERDRLREAVAQNEIAVETAQAQYKAGSSDFLSVLTVQNQLLASQARFVEATTEISRSVTRLYRTLGGGWENAFPVTRSSHS